MLLTPEELQTFLLSRQDDPETQALLRRIAANGATPLHGAYLTLFSLWKQQADEAEALIRSLPT